MTATVAFLVLFVLATGGYLMLFEFSRGVLLGDFTATGPEVNLSIFAALTMLAGIGFLRAHRRDFWVGLYCAIVSPVVFATLFAEALLLYYWCTGQSSPFLVPPDDCLTWLWKGPMTVALQWYIFLPPAVAGSLALAICKKHYRSQHGVFD